MWRWLPTEAPSEFVMRESTASPASSERRASSIASSGASAPRMVEIEVGNLARQRFRLDEAGVRVLCGEAGDRSRLLHRVAHRLRAQIGGARGALALAEIDRDAEAPIALIFDGIHFPQAHGDAQPLADAGIGFTLRCSTSLGFFEHEAHDIL